jgi:hypothetical protein
MNNRRTCEKKASLHFDCWKATDGLSRACYTMTWPAWALVYGVWCMFLSNQTVLKCNHHWTLQYALHDYLSSLYKSQTSNSNNKSFNNVKQSTILIVIKIYCVDKTRSQYSTLIHVTAPTVLAVRRILSSAEFWNEIFHQVTRITSSLPRSDSSLIMKLSALQVSQSIYLHRKV